jgi:hypothetical protein
MGDRRGEDEKRIFTRHNDASVFSLLPTYTHAHLSDKFLSSLSHWYMLDIAEVRMLRNVYVVMKRKYWRRDKESKSWAMAE